MTKTIKMQAQWIRDAVDDILETLDLEGHLDSGAVSAATKASCARDLESQYEAELEGFADGDEWKRCLSCRSPMENPAMLVCPDCRSKINGEPYQ